MTDLDLFCGARGWEALAADLGIDALGFDNNPDAIATSMAAGLRATEIDLSQLDPRDLDCDLRGLIASPPCQTFSAAGNGSGRRNLDVVLQAIRATASGGFAIASQMAQAAGDPRTALIVQPLHYALTLRPEWTVWEQVPAVLPVWEACAEILSARGYHTAVGVLNAEQYGVPQTRRRAFLLASRAHPVSLPRPTHSKFYSRSPHRLDEGVHRWVSMAQALGWDEDTVSNYRTNGDPGNRVVAVKSMGRGMVERYGERPGREADQPAFTIRAAAGGTEPGGFRWTMRNNNQAKACERDLDEPAGTLFFGKRVNTVEWMANGAPVRQMTVAEAATLQTFPGPWMVGAGLQGCAKPRHVEEPATSVTTRGNAYWITDPDHYSRRGQSTVAEHGALQVLPPEQAAIQTFPDGWPFQGGKSAQFLQIGNAVPPLLARAVLQAVIHPDVNSTTVIV